MMKTSRKHKRLVLAAAGLVVAASIAVAAFASAGSNGGIPGVKTPGQISAAEHAALIRRAVHFRTLAHKIILRRQAALRGRTLKAGAAPDPLALAAMRDVARSMASFNADAHPYSGQVFSSTRKFAETVISGDTVNTDQPAFVVVFHGNFLGYLASPPPGARLPTGHVMTIVFDAQTLEVTDWGLVDQTPATARLGAASPLSL
jgi:hypothetical protein